MQAVTCIESKRVLALYAMGPVKFQRARCRLSEKRRALAMRGLSSCRNNRQRPVSDRYIGGAIGVPSDHFPTGTLNSTTGAGSQDTK